MPPGRWRSLAHRTAATRELRPAYAKRRQARRAGHCVSVSHCVERQTDVRLPVTLRHTAWRVTPASPLTRALRRAELREKKEFQSGCGHTRGTSQIAYQSVRKLRHL